MHHDFIDKFSRLESPIHHARAALKAGVALGLVVLVVVLPIAWAWIFAVVALFLALVVSLSTIPPTFVLGRLLLLEPLVAGVALLTIFQPGGSLIALSIVVKSTLCLAAMILLANTTSFAELLQVLRQIRVPSLLVTMLALMYRYLFVLIDEAERMKRARASRTFSNRRAHAWKTFAMIIGQLFVRSTERAERIYSAMCARGWK